jgi:hypothetical protein
MVTDMYIYVLRSPPSYLTPLITYQQPQSHLPPNADPTISSISHLDLLKLNRKLIHSLIHSFTSYFNATISQHVKKTKMFPLPRTPPNPRLSLHRDRRGTALRAVWRASLGSMSGVETTGESTTAGFGWG